MEIGVMEFFYLLEGPDRHIMLESLKEFEEREMFLRMMPFFKVFNKF